MQTGFNQMEKLYFFEGKSFIQINEKNEKMINFNSEVIIYNTNNRKTFFSIEEFCEENNIEIIFGQDYNWNKIFEKFSELKFKVYLRVFIK